LASVIAAVFDWWARLLLRLLQVSGGAFASRLNELASHQTVGQVARRDFVSGR